MKNLSFLVITLMALNTWAQSEPQTEPLLATESLGRCSQEVRQSSLKIICPLDAGGHVMKYLISRKTVKDNQEAAAFCARDSEMVGLDDITFPNIAYFMISANKTLVEAMNPAYVVVGTQERYLSWASMTPQQLDAFKRFKNLRQGYWGSTLIKMMPSRMQEQIDSSLELAQLTVYMEGESFSSSTTNVGQLYKQGLLETIPELPAVCASMTRQQLMKRNN